MNLPIFFDRIGILVFLYILIDSVYDLKNKKMSGKDRIKVWIRFIIGLLGLIVDGTLVFLYG